MRLGDSDSTHKMLQFLGEKYTRGDKLLPSSSNYCKYFCFLKIFITNLIMLGLLAATFRDAKDSIKYLACSKIFRCRAAAGIV